MIIPATHGQAVLKFSGTAAGEGAAVVFGIERPGLTAAQTAAAIGNLWDTTLKAVTSGNLQLDEVLVKFGPTSTGPFGISTRNSYGSVNGGTDPPQVCWLIRKITESGGRAGRGRMYYPGVFSANSSDGGFIDLPTLQAWQAKLDDFLEGLAVGGSGMVVLHNSALAPTPVTALEIQPQVATQRRRLR